MKISIIRLFIFVAFLSVIFSNCSKEDSPIEGVDQSETDFFFTGEFAGELLDIHTISEDTLIGARVGGGSTFEPGICGYDYYSKIYNNLPLFASPSVEIGLMSFYKGPCQSQEQIDEFDDAFTPGIYPFNVHNFGQPAIENSVSIQIQRSSSSFYNSDNTDNTSSFFEITSSVEFQDNDDSYKKRIIEGEISCNLKKTTSSEIIELKNASFKILVSIEK